MLTGPTVQQEETPQPPPLRPEGGAGVDGVKLFSEDVEQLKADKTFFTLFEEH
jgi:hypothetical protein